MKMTLRIVSDAAKAISATMKAPDYEKLANDEAFTFMLDRLSPEILAAYNHRRLRKFIYCSSAYVSNTGQITKVGLPGFSCNDAPPKEVIEIYEKYSKLLDKHKRKKIELETEAKNSLLAFKTVKQAVAELPELVKYLPDITVPNPLPLACVNVMEKLRAAGFVEA
jgi:hypothetical protein